ncbi:hypothetical protein PAAG_07877 [Paracoccidioides lutzii Pb01]|uniref:Uncharacterized protein n=1 Tax=Paracoccidioides lutzii (strain ATCC MYA-826 / Pb01) TaxID=502779 RepID=C1HAP8_PARBA|nr:hypothetical protein PAAG_07877 [Paracoccidioides lutzii Pb01]EEH37459.2 hypothetical protein PAAG_07877 [Paracoccidioides lutzii Pb01]
MSQECNLLFVKLYVAHANRTITDRIRDDKLDEISRAKIEMEVLEEVEKGKFPFENSNGLDVHDAIKRLDVIVSLDDDLISPPPPSTSPEPLSPSSSSPSPSTTASGSPEPGAVKEPSDSESSPEVVVPSIETVIPEVLPSPPKRRLTRQAPPAKKAPAGVSKRRAPAKEKQIPAATAELEKSASSTEPERPTAGGKTVSFAPDPVSDEEVASSVNSLFGNVETPPEVQTPKKRRTPRVRGKGAKQTTTTRQTRASSRASASGKAPAAPAPGVGKGKEKGKDS